MTQLHAGGKFDNNSYKVSGGLHGVGVSVVNALSSQLDLEIWRGGKVYDQRYCRGETETDFCQTGTTKRRGTRITFKPDADIFSILEFEVGIQIPIRLRVIDDDLQTLSVTLVAASVSEGAGPMALAGTIAGTASAVEASAVRRMNSRRSMLRRCMAKPFVVPQR